MSALTMGTLLMFVAASAPSPVEQSPSTLTHHMEVKLFASTMAIAKTASVACGDDWINTRYLTDLKTRLRITDDDREQFAKESNAMVALLDEGLLDASNVKVWCAAVYRLYGPGGTMIPGLLHR